MMCDSTVTYALAQSQCSDVAVYANGYTTSPSSIPFHTGHTLWIDVVGDDTSANVADVEPHALTPSMAGNWIATHDRVSQSHCGIVYTDRSEWPATQAAVANAAPSACVRWWIADPTGMPHTLDGADAVQWGWLPDIDYSTTTPSLWDAA